MKKFSCKLNRKRRKSENRKKMNTQYNMIIALDFKP